MAAHIGKLPNVQVMQTDGSANTQQGRENPVVLTAEKGRAA